MTDVFHQVVRSSRCKPSRFNRPTRPRIVEVHRSRAGICEPAETSPNYRQRCDEGGGDTGYGKPQGRSAGWHNCVSLGSGLVWTCARGLTPHLKLRGWERSCESTRRNRLQRCAKLRVDSRGQLCRAKRTAVCIMWMSSTERQEIEAAFTRHMRENTTSGQMSHCPAGSGPGAHTSPASHLKRSHSAISSRQRSTDPAKSNA